MMKCCNKCLNNKPTGMFYRNSKRLDGFNGLCRDCANTTTKITKRCYKCCIEKNVLDFNKDSSRYDGLYSLCRMCSMRKSSINNSLRKKSLVERRKTVIFPNFIKCLTCNIEKDLNNFSDDVNQLLGKSTKCKQCTAKYYLENKDRINEYNKNYQIKNRESLSSYKKRWLRDNPGKKYQYKSKWSKKRRESDPLWDFNIRIRSAIQRVFKVSGIRKATKSEILLGCSIKNFFEILGPRPSVDYVIDHICPIAQAKTESELIKLNNHKNLRWLTRKENQVKSDKPTLEAVQKCKEILGRDWI